jgi:U3 small nucleolar RNA-associated protein 18
MVKHARKRQKTSDIVHDVQSSQIKEGRIMDDENKDDEERRLESLLFGVKYRPRDEDEMKNSDEREGYRSREEEEERGGGMGHLLDQDVCRLLS